MPFKSQAQRGYLWANKPEIAREFADEEARIRRKKKHKEQIKYMK